MSTIQMEDGVMAWISAVSSRGGMVEVVIEPLNILPEDDPLDLLSHNDAHCLGRCLTLLHCCVLVLLEAPLVELCCLVITALLSCTDISYHK
ncbi:unnamed protein product [Pleuronectes platessa]|uniref:Uncharacterized protein n=1 Tax=Pleuronectes platessa TaxID=8262 RepID=A0A9N7Z4R9_PLEPL|nr:unnamed protein product [Pleuronectes platessa]